MKEIKIFSPDVIFKDELESSWCKGIKTRTSKSLIPVIKSSYEGKPVIDLDPAYELKNNNTIDESNSFVIVIPLNKNWNVSNLEENFDKLILTFFINISNPTLCYIDIELTSLVYDQESSSNKINLVSSIKQEAGWQRINIPMIAFRINNKEFIPTCTRLFKFICTGWSKIMVGDIRIIESDFFGGNKL